MCRRNLFLSDIVTYRRQQSGLFSGQSNQFVQQGCRRRLSVCPRHPDQFQFPGRIIPVIPGHYSQSLGGICSPYISYLFRSVFRQLFTHYRNSPAGQRFVDKSMSVRIDSSLSDKYISRVRFCVNRNGYVRSPGRYPIYFSDIYSDLIIPLISSSLCAALAALFNLLS